MNLYQKGLISVSVSEQEALATGLLPQVGTADCVNTLVPHTGNAVPGFCPGVVQIVCAIVLPAVTKVSKIQVNNFIR